MLSALSQRFRIESLFALRLSEKRGNATPRFLWVPIVSIRQQYKFLLDLYFALIYIALYSKESAGDEMSKDEKGRCISFTL